MMSEKQNLGQEVKERMGLEDNQPFYEGNHHGGGLGSRKFRLYGVGRERKEHQTDSFQLYGNEPNPIRRYAPMAAALLASGLVVAGAMMLLGPASSRRSRRKIRGKTIDLAKDAIGSVGKAAGDVVDKAGDVVSATRKIGRKVLHR